MLTFEQPMAVLAPNARPWVDGQKEEKWFIFPILNKSEFMCPLSSGKIRRG
jgi:hypothetical protein